MSQKHHPKKGSPPAARSESSAEDPALDDELSNTDESTEEDASTSPYDAPTATVDAVDLAEVAPQPTEPTYVTVTPCETVPSCTIGGVLYSFRAGHKARVPVDVARHLRDIGVVPKT